MKRVLSLVAATVVALLLAGCGEEAPKPTSATPSTEAAPAAAPEAAPAEAAPAEAAPAEAAPAPAEEDKSNQ